MITLPYPPSELSPNARIHWARKSKFTKNCRTRAAWETKAAGVKVDWEGKIDVHISFYPPDNRRRDRDNMFFACKAYLDGIADALGVNDSLFQPHIYMGDPVKGGKVVFRVMKPEEDSRMAREIDGAADVAEMPANASLRGAEPVLSAERPSRSES